MKLYNGNSFDAFAEEHRNKIVNEVNSQSDTYILNVNVDDYAAHLGQKYSLDIPEFHFDKVYVDTVERDIPGSKFPRYEFMISDTSEMFRKQIIIYHSSALVGTPSVKRIHVEAIY